MENLFSYICSNAHEAHWIIFILLLLSGFNIPISEDLLLLCGGAIAGSCIPDHTIKLYIWVFLGAYISAWEAFWIGRLLGPKLYKIPMIGRSITPARLEWLRHFYAKFGVFTFIVGRFMPGGIRNALFFTSGFTKMPFYLFILRDGFACLLSSFVFFSIGYHFAKNFDVVTYYFHHYTKIILAILIVAVSVALAIYYYFKKQK